MADQNSLMPVHPAGEDHSRVLARTLESALSAARSDPAPVRVQTPGGVVFVEWDPQAPLTPIGQLVFFVQFLDVCGHFESLCEACPVRLSSPNAPSAREVLGTLLLGILCGQQRYAHLSALRFDPVNPGLLGMRKVVSEDSARRYLAAMSDEQSGWSLFVGLIEPSKHAEAITSRAQLLHGVARVTQSGRQTTLSVTSTHGRAAHIQERQSWVGRFLGKLKEAAEQLTRFDLWRLILSSVFVRFLKGRIIGTPHSRPPHALA